MIRKAEVSKITYMRSADLNSLIDSKPQVIRGMLLSIKHFKVNPV